MIDKEKSQVPKKKFFTYQTVIVIIIISLLVALYIWDRAEDTRIEKKHKAEIENIKTRAGNTISDNNLNNIKTLTRVFSWAVRSEMLRNNMEQVDNYMTDLVKTADLNDISVIKTDGIVILSTNKKYEGNTYPGFVASELNKINETVSKDDKNGNIMSICPIIGLDSRLGTVVITYTPKTYNFDEKE
jgi:C4-dicarboxylate-specific signal transduction histidine kinase